LTPICAAKLWREARSRRDNLAENSQTKSPKAVKTAVRIGGPDVAALHCPYVVMMQQVDFISKDILPVWRFNHPNYAVLPKNTHNTRKFKCTFEIPAKAAVHGFAGYFEATLYKDITLSTKPGSETEGMVSWFPIWFPLAQPMTLNDSCELDVSFWRSTDGRRVWYEWLAESHLIISRPTGPKRIRLSCTPLHNPGGIYSSMTL
jgi:protein arginine N-methyltransferase 5